MSVTKRDVCNQFHNSINVEQVGKKQLFIVSYTGYRLLVSYYTIVGIATDLGGRWRLTKQRYRVTTSKQITQFLQMHEGGLVDQTELDNLLSEYHEK